VKKLLKSVYIYGSYRKNKIGVPFFGPPCIWLTCVGGGTSLPQNHWRRTRVIGMV